MGKNGAGKSTLMKTLVGLLEPEAGTVRYDGTDVTEVPVDECAGMGVGYMPQGRDVFPNLTVKQNLLVGRADQRDAGEDAIRRGVRPLPHP